VRHHRAREAFRRGAPGPDERAKSASLPPIDEARRMSQRYSSSRREAVARSDADISEAVDFCRYYASRCAGSTGAITQAVPVSVAPGLHAARRGRAIAPWEFPLAILTGLVVAPLVPQLPSS